MFADSLGSLGGAARRHADAKAVGMAPGVMPTRTAVGTAPGTGFCAMWQDKRDGNIDLYFRNNLGPCTGDVDGDGDTDLADLGALLAS
jgi:hypothetical protein